MKNTFITFNTRRFAVAGYIILPLQFFLAGFWVLQGFAGVSIDYINLGFGFIPSDYFFSVIFLLNAVLLLSFGFSIYSFGKSISAKPLYLSGLFIVFLNTTFLALTLFQRFARLPDAPFLFGFYQSFDPEWIFWVLGWYSLLSLLALVFVSVSIVILGQKGTRKMLIAGVILLVGIIVAILLDFLNMGILSPIFLYIGMPFVAKQVRRVQNS